MAHWISLFVRFRGLKAKRQQGFTLIEMVMTLVILGIISLAIGGYIQLGTEGYMSTVSRDRFQTEARFVLEKMTREIRNAAPNSIQAKGNCLSFYPIHYVGFYLGEPSTTSINIVPTLGSEADWLEIPAHTGKLALAVGLPSADAYADLPYRILSVAVDSQNSSAMSVSLPSVLAYTSPAKRAYVYGDAVSYCQVGNSLMRNDIVVGEHIQSMDFDVTGAGLENNGMVNIGLVMNNPKSGETFSYEHTVQVMNVL